MTVSKKTVIVSLVWKFLERGSVQLVSFVVALVLARLLGPDDYGIVSLVLVFTSVSLVFVQGGFNTALVQRKEVEAIDWSSALVFSCALATLIYGMLFAAAPAIAAFYNQPEVEHVLRVLALILFPGAYNSVQVAHATKHFQFKRLFVATLAAAVLSGFIGIALAYSGWGVWALVAQQLMSQCLVCIVLAVLLQWRPGHVFSFSSIKTLFAFGGNVLASNLLVQLFLNLRSLIVGKVFDTVTLGLFNRGRQFSTAVMEAVIGSMQEVMLPTFSSLQNSKQRLLSAVRKSIRVSCFIIFPLMFGLSAVAPTLVSLLLGNAWMGCVPYLQIFALSYCFQPMQIIGAQAMRGVGNSAATLKLEIARKAAELCLMFVSISFGPVALAQSSVAAGCIACIIALFPNSRLLGYSFAAQLRDLAQPFFGSLAMHVIVCAVGAAPLNGWALLALQVFVGIFSYAAMQVILRNELMSNMMAIARLHAEKRSC